MNLAKMQELEDAKADLRKYGERQNDLIQGRKQKFFASAVVDFESFFNDKGFQVSTYQNNCTARYVDLTIQLDIPEVGTPYVGSYSVFDLHAGDTNYKIILNELGHYPRFTTTISSAPKTEEEKFQKEIDDTKKHAEEIKNYVDQFSATKWGYGFVKATESKTDREYPQFATFKELLEDLFK